MGDMMFVGGAYAGLKSAMETVQAFVTARDTVIKQTVAVELLGQILAAQNELRAAQERESALATEIDKLEKQIADAEAWDRQKGRYQLTRLEPGVMVYAVKEDARGEEPAHYVCANCFEKKHRSFLNQDEPTNGVSKLHCPSCGFDDRIGNFRMPNVNRGPRGGDWRS